LLKYQTIYKRTSFTKEVPFTKDKTTNFNHAYDDVFKSLKHNHKELFIPIINDLFGKHYTRADDADLLPSEGYIINAESPDGNADIEGKTSDFLLKIGNDTYLLECQSYNDGSMAIRIVEYAFISAKQNAVWENGRCFLTMPHYRIIYVKSSLTTPDKTKITFTFPDGKSVDYDADNVILKEYTKEEIMDRQLYPYIPYYILRYEKDIKSGTKNIDNIIHDLEYFRIKLKEALDKELITSYDEYNLRAYVNTIIKHITNGNDYEERLVNTMGGTLIVTEADKIYYAAKEEDIRIFVESFRENGFSDDKIKQILMKKFHLTHSKAESYL